MSFVHPATHAFVERLPTLTKKGAHRTKGHKLHLGLCDVCFEATWVAESDLKVTWTCPTCLRLSTRQGSPSAPVCVGRKLRGEQLVHDPIEMTTDDSVPGKACRMTPGCPGRHRRDGITYPRKEIA